jgi:hypothetical protein
MSNTSRRALLAGAATLPVLSIPAVAAATDGPDTPVMRLFAELKLAWAEWNQLKERANRIKEAVDAGLPPVPPQIQIGELKHPDFACLENWQRRGERYIDPDAVVDAIMGASRGRPPRELGNL